MNDKPFASAAWLCGIHVNVTILRCNLQVHRRRLPHKVRLFISYDWGFVNVLVKPLQLCPIFNTEEKASLRSPESLGFRELNLHEGKNCYYLPSHIFVN